MLVKAFARKHQVCEWGEPFFQPVFEREVADLDYEQLPKSGRALIWVAVAAGINGKRVTRCACDLVEQVIPLVPSDQEELAAAISTVRSWAEGNSSLREVNEVRREANRLRSEHEDEVVAKAWLAVNRLAASARASIAAAAAADIAVRAAAASGGTTLEDFDAQLATIVQNAFPWSEVATQINADAPSPVPREKTLAETEQEAASIEKTFAQVQSQIEQSKKAIQDAMDSIGLSPEILEELMQNPEFLREESSDQANDELEQIKAQWRARSEAESVSAKPRKTKRPRRNRLAV